MADPDGAATHTDEASASESSASESSASESSASEATDQAVAPSPFLQKVQAPISDEEPAGGKVTYDDDFQQLKTQINEIGAASGSADYGKIVKLGRRILTEKSKDLRAAGYLVIGEARLNGASGMAEAVKGVRVLIDTFWEELYPAKRRMRGRGNALQFISDRLGDWLEVTAFEPDDRDALVAARDDLKAIQDFGLKEMGEDAPSLSGLLKTFDKAIKKLPDPEPELSEAPEASGTAEDAEGADEKSPAQQRAGRAPAPTEIASDSNAKNAVTRAVAYFRAADTTDPIPYRLIRTIRWGALRTVPPNESGKTRLEAPRAQRREYLSGLLDQDDYETLIEEAESSFQAGSFHVWLDGQRLLASALGALGKPYEDARTAVMLDTALLVQRLPELPTLSFSDGTPFASPLTAEWLEMQVQPLLGGGDGAAQPGRTVVEDMMPVTTHYEEARQQLTAGDLAGALEHMHDGAAQDTTQKEQFHRRFYVATLCVKGGKPAVALPLLEALDDLIARHALDAWNPPLALAVWTTLHQCCDQLVQQASGDERDALAKRSEQAFAKICRVDARHALPIADRRAS